jgi:Family of unknown function (DUF6152)
MKNLVKNFGVRCLVVSAAMVAMVGIESAQAHHSFAMFDRSRELLLSGSVVRWAYNSPHIALYMETEDGTLYSFEGAAPPALLSRTPPMNGFTFQPGQVVKVVYCPLHDGRPGGAIGFIIDAEGIFYSPNDGGCGPSQDWKKWVSAGYTSRAEAESAKSTR